MDARSRLLTIKEMSKKSNNSESYYYNGKSNGTLDLPWIKIGKSVRVRESDFENWLDAHIQK